ncbi:helix-turn-helix domain-containing protein [Chitinophaga flava]|uniref:HTH araC/xylS-type domain-containing protein n=1 Tax=Chitinophaga flava TaxID=2259036 RepID=A0A365XPB6_9BACT|nr:helix-turn-helix domain-containing protein [Chitinophaga flava]RBL88189.1 hypothetical protein DF182_16440 [Chitinophaga flava]
MKEITDQLYIPSHTRNHMQNKEEIEKLIVDNVKAWIEEVYDDDFQFNKNFCLDNHIQSRLSTPLTEVAIWFIDRNAKTIQQYAMEVRVNKVKELLVYTNLDLIAIAGKLGYSSVRIMSAELIQLTGLPISFFQNIKQQKEDMAKRLQ